MRNLFLTAFLFVVTTGSSQVIKSNILTIYKEGDVLENGVYADKKEAIATDTWQGAFTSYPVEGVGSPVLGRQLIYHGSK